MATRDLVRIALFAAVIGALGLLPKFDLPLAGGVPITAQSLGVMLAGIFLGPRNGALAVLLFLFVVALGVPLLAGGRGGLDRPSLHLSVVRIDEPARRAAWLARHLRDLPGSGIVYALTVSAAHDLAALLSDHGYPVAAYTGQTDPAEREQLVVGNAAPQEKREPRGQLEIADRVRRPGRHAGRLALDAEQELRADEQAAHGALDAALERATLASFAIERE